MPHLAESGQALVEFDQRLTNIRHVDATEKGRRLRAAMGYGGLKDDDVMGALNISESTLGRIKRGERDLDPEEAGKVAGLAKLPPAFFDVDFSLLDDLPAEQPEWATSLRQRMDQLEDEWNSAKLDALGAALEALRQSGGESP